VTQLNHQTINNYEMIDIYLFDWGDTLMVDFPGVPGKMCNWIIVEILSELGISADRVAMVGDDPVKDIEPAAAVGIKPIWLSRGDNKAVSPSGTKIIGNLRELCI
jgi:predicted HAD superfamily phosphohydrolase YqeG